MAVTCDLEMRRKHAEHVPVASLQSLRSAGLFDTDITRRAWMRSFARIDAENGLLLRKISQV